MCGGVPMTGGTLYVLQTDTLANLSNICGTHSDIHNVEDPEENEKTRGGTAIRGSRFSLSHSISPAAWPVGQQSSGLLYTVDGGMVCVHDHEDSAVSNQWRSDSVSLILVCPEAQLRKFQESDAILFDCCRPFHIITSASLSCPSWIHKYSAAIGLACCSRCNRGSLLDFTNFDGSPVYVLLRSKSLASSETRNTQGENNCGRRS